MSKKQDVEIKNRFSYIESMILCSGGVTRNDVSHKFGVHKINVSADFKEYKNRHPDNIVYSSSQKKYIAGEGFSLHYFKFNHISDLLELNDSSVSCELWPVQSRRYKTQTLVSIIRSIRDKRKVLIKYQGISRKESTERWILPTRIVQTLTHWHVRSWCYLREGWRDFVIGRITEIEKIGEVENNEMIDKEWEERITLTLKINQNLSLGQQVTTSSELKIVGDKIEIQIPRAMLKYYESEYSHKSLEPDLLVID